MKRRRRSDASVQTSKRQKIIDESQVARIATKIYNRQEAKNAELKYWDVEDVSNATTNAGTIYNISLSIAQGTGVNDRIGDAVKAKSLFLRYDFIASGGATASYETVRLIALRWYASGVPSVSSILSLTTSTTHRPLSMLEMDNTKLFKVIYDKTHCLSDSANWDLPGKVYEKVFIDLDGTINWSNAGGGEKGQVVLLAISDTIANHPAFSFVSRIRYTDS